MSEERKRKRDLIQQDTEQLAEDLSEKGLSVGTYHAGLEDYERDKVHKKWISNKTKIIVGMNEMNAREMR